MVPIKKYGSLNSARDANTISELNELRNKVKKEADEKNKLEKELSELRSQLDEVSVQHSQFLEKSRLQEKEGQTPEQLLLEVEDLKK